jgi:hypothetical protein
VLVLAQKRGDLQLRPALAATWPQLLHGFLPLFVVVKSIIFTLLLSDVFIIAVKIWKCQIQ